MSEQLWVIRSFLMLGYFVTAYFVELGYESSSKYYTWQTFIHQTLWRDWWPSDEHQWAWTLMIEKGCSMVIPAGRIPPQVLSCLFMGFLGGSHLGLSVRFLTWWWRGKHPEYGRVFETMIYYVEGLVPSESGLLRSGTKYFGGLWTSREGARGECTWVFSGDCMRKLCAPGGDLDSEAEIWTRTRRKRWVPRLDFALNWLARDNPPTYRKSCICKRYF
ncbi:hypothetical protein FB451DRAFT_1176799 [Mycena latifolia]|nr:hypothetical protein FB451DRAFT_1176799 [Mycena latifolia]